jgi:orotate phosphoribosyltransferase
VNHPDWLKPIHDPRELRRVVNLIVAEIGRLNPPPRFLAVRGTSGTAIGGAVSLVSDLPLVVVRKDEDDSHAKHYGIVQGMHGTGGYYVIVDDLVDSGNTVQAIASAVKRDHESYADNALRTECIAVILYSADQVRRGAIDIDGRTVPLITPNYSR